MMKNTIRRDIQGYRAVAVISVILFHCNGLLPGGFIGVDLFFVISGFVITQSIHSTWLETGTLNFIDFYVRRIKRLLPALSVMITVFSILVFFLFSPLGMQQNASKTAIGSLLLSGNYIADKVTSNYFSLPALTNPFLHTWSLSVEEQFYLVFPILFLLIYRLTSQRRKKFYFSLAIFTISIFSISLMYWHALPGWYSGFYSPLTRAWEFGIGILAFLISEKFSLWGFKNRKLDYLKSALSISIIFCIIFFNESTGFPSLTLLLPVFSLGTLLLIGNANTFSKLLNSRAAQYVGDRSYSLYLWHWPFIVLLNYLFPSNLWALITGLILGLVFAFATYGFIENPIRKMQKTDFKTISLLCSFFLIIPLVLSLSVGYTAKHVYFPRYESGAIQGKYEGDIGAIGFESFTKANSLSCRNGLANPDIQECEADIAVLGDSHADHLVPGLIDNYPNLAVLDLGNEFFIAPETSQSKIDKKLLVNNDFVKIVVINKYWAHSGVPNQIRALIKSLSDSDKKVVILDDVPNFPFDAFTCKYGKSIFLNSSSCTIPREKFDRQLSQYQPQLDSLLRISGNVIIFNSSQIFCSKDNCSMVKNGVLNYLDLNHLNVNGSKLVTRRMIHEVPIFCEVLADKLSSGCK